MRKLRLRIFQGHRLAKKWGNWDSQSKTIGLQKPHVTPWLKSSGLPKVFQAKETG